MKWRYILTLAASAAMSTAPKLTFAVPIQLTIEQLVQSSFGDQAPTDGSFSQLSPAAIDYAINTDFKFFVPSTPHLGRASGFLDSVFDAPTGGCSPSDFAGFTPGTIALLGNPSCFFSDQVNNASAAGAIGAIATVGFPVGLSDFGLLDPVTIPSLIISRSLATRFHDSISRSIPVPTTLLLVGVGLAFLHRRRSKR